MASMQRSAGPGSFPLSADELLDVESWATAFVSADGLKEDYNATPGHHRATLLLDGSSSSSSGGSSHSGSFDATTPAAPEHDFPSTTKPAAEACYQDPAQAAGNPSTPAAHAEQQQAPIAAPAADTTTTTSSSRSSLGGHAAPSTLQLPDFSAFLLPEECAFAETTTEDALATPTPHTPVVPNNVFADNGLPVVSARTCRPHYSSGGGGCSTTSSSSGGASNSSSSSGGGGGICDDCPNTAGGSNGSTGGGSSSMQQLGTCRALLLDNGDDEFELDPFPEPVPNSPSSHRHHAPGSSSGGRWQTYAGLEILQNGGWDSGPGFTSLLCRRTLSTVSEATHEGLDSESASSTPSATRTGAAPPQPDQQQQQEQPGQQEQPQQQPLMQQGQQLGPAVGNPDLAADADTAAILLELCFGTQQVASQQQQQQQQQHGAACQATAEDSPAAGAGAAAVSGACDIQTIMTADIQQQQWQQRPDKAGLERAAAAAAATAETAASDQSAAVKVADDAPGSVEAVLIEITADATAAATAAPVAGGADASLEDVWEVANKQRLQQLQQRQEQAEQQVSRLSYPAAEAQLLAALNSSSSSTGSRTRLQLNSNQMPAAAAACSQHKQPQGLLQRLLRLCGCNRSSGGAASQAQQGQRCQQVLQLAQAQFSDDSSLHLALLQAVHCACTGQAGHVPRRGSHWAVLGFQGDDPATDLRGAGLLGLLQLLHLHWHDPKAAGRIWELSQSTDQEFPLAIVSFNVTTWALGALRAGRLDAAAAQLGGSQLAAANLFHCSAMYEFHSRWLRDKRTMLDSGVVLKQLERYCSSHCKQLLQLARRDGRN